MTEETMGKSPNYNRLYNYTSVNLFDRLCFISNICIGKFKRLIQMGD